MANTVKMLSAICPLSGLRSTPRSHSPSSQPEGIQKSRCRSPSCRRSPRQTGTRVFQGGIHGEGRRGLPGEESPVLVVNEEIDIVYIKSKIRGEDEDASSRETWESWERTDTERMENASRLATLPLTRRIRPRHRAAVRAIKLVNHRVSFAFKESRLLRKILHSASLIIHPLPRRCGSILVAAPVDLLAQVADVDVHHVGSAAVVVVQM